MVTIWYYAFVVIAIAIPVALIYFAVSRAHRICKTRTWPKVIALGFALIFLLATVAPYAKYGSEWASAWAYLLLPFSIILEVAATLGFPLYVFIVSTIAAAFWGALVYVISAIILRLRGVRSDDR